MYIGASGQNVTIVASPNNMSYTVGATLTLHCIVNSSAIPTNATVPQFMWQCSGCFANGNTSQNISRNLTDMDSSMINCTANISGMIMTSSVFILRVTQGTYKAIHYLRSTILNFLYCSK